MDIDKFIKDKGLKVDCIVESDIDVEKYVQYEVRDLIKEAFKEQLRLYSVVVPKGTLCDVCGSENTIDAPHMGSNCLDCNPI